MKYRIPVVKLQVVRDGTLSGEGQRPQVSEPRGAADLFQSYIGDADREIFAVLLLDTKNRIIGISTVSIGTLNAALVHPREIFKLALAANAAAVILGHNHPSGDPTPSPEDLEVTKRIRDAGELMGISVLDHVVLGENGRFVSFRETGNW